METREFLGAEATRRRIEHVGDCLCRHCGEPIFEGESYWEWAGDAFCCWAHARQGIIEARNQYAARWGGVA